MTPSAREGPSKKGGVPAVERAIAIMAALADAPEPLSLAALTARVGLPKSSVLGLCSTLVEGGLLKRVPEGGYHLGVRIVDLAHAYLAKSDLTREFVQTWESLSAIPQETIVLAVLDASDVVYVACRNGAHGLALNYRIGMRLPATCTASGKALLATLPAKSVSALFRSGPLRQLTRRSLPDAKALLADLRLTRERGYAIDDEETREGMCCIGAPVFDAFRDHAVAAVAVSMLKAEFHAGGREKAAASVRQFAEVLSQRLGGERGKGPGRRASEAHEHSSNHL